ncbi:MAG: hypothetical protein AAGI34_09585 [Pseudomonadota bacterium]
MTDQIALSANDTRLYQRGLTAAHSSDDDGMCDLGASVGLGNGNMLYVGERPGRDGWCICVYRQSETISIAEGLEGEQREAAMDLIDEVAAAINGSDTT